MNDKTWSVNGVDLITVDKMVDTLKEKKNRNAIGPDGINIELITYGCTLFLWRLLHLLNERLQTSQVPE